MLNKSFIRRLTAALLLLVLIGTADREARAHFGMIIPSDDIVDRQSAPSVELDIMFAHPFEGESMEMAQPRSFGVVRGGRTTLLTETLRPTTARLVHDASGSQSWKASYSVKRPGDHIFFVEPEPYWEPAEDSYIVHYTKVIVNGFGKEDSWDSEIGLKTEIIPLSRPYGLYTGNLFRGIVHVDGKPVPFAEIEVEYFNENGNLTAPDAAFVTQVIKADDRGMFSYAVPKAGWWGFAALSTDTRTLERNGTPKPVEIGAVIWIRATDMITTR
ncbi:MAG: DUF4198 domain-containing protein [Prosthecochloris sp.]|nr:DUF4198 domain-containing protein [Prosthecochloris sp.]